MARPHNLQTKGYFSVMEKYGTYYLVFRGKYKIMESPSRQHLYTKRARYSSWFEAIVALLKSTNTKLEDIR